MATQQTNSFTTYSLTDTEYLQGSLLMENQTQVIQNQIADLAETLLKLEYNPDPAQALTFVQQQSYMRGQLDSLQYLLTCSEAAAESIQGGTQEAVD